MGDRALRSVMLTRLTQLHMNVVLYRDKSLTLNSVQRLLLWQQSITLLHASHCGEGRGESVHTPAWLGICVQLAQVACRREAQRACAPALGGV